MTERPILFSGPLVRAILARAKTETRRLVTPKTSVVGSGYPWEQLDFEAHVCTSTPSEDRPNRGEPCGDRCLGRDYCCALVDGKADNGGQYVHIPGKEETRHRIYCRTTPGDVLLVRESWRTCATVDYAKLSELSEDAPILYAADKQVRGETGEWGKGRPSIFLPKWASRIRLRVTEVLVQRLQWITGRDVLAEGVDNGASNAAMGQRWENMQRMEFERLWDSINGKRPGASWAANPWVWVLRFERLP